MYVCLDGSEMPFTTITSRSDVYASVVVLLQGVYHCSKGCEAHNSFSNESCGRRRKCCHSVIVQAVHREVILIS